MAGAVSWWEIEHPLLPRRTILTAPAESCKGGGEGEGSDHRAWVFFLSLDSIAGYVSEECACTTGCVELSTGVANLVLRSLIEV
jgi:hypothetical protein